MKSSVYDAMTDGLMMDGLTDVRPMWERLEREFISLGPVRNDGLNDQPSSSSFKFSGIVTDNP
jgi:hypothetical protein